MGSKMKMYDLEGFCIKQEEKINYIHKVNDEVIINEYINHKLTFEANNFK